MVCFQDKEMYDEVSDTPAVARTSNLNEELGQVSRGSGQNASCVLNWVRSVQGLVNTLPVHWAGSGQYRVRTILLSHKESLTLVFVRNLHLKELGRFSRGSGQCYCMMKWVIYTLVVARTSYLNEVLGQVNGSGQQRVKSIVWWSEWYIHWL